MRIVQKYVMTHLDELARALRQIREVEQIILSTLESAHSGFARLCKYRDKDTDECKYSSPHSCLHICKAELCPHIKAE